MATLLNFLISLIKKSSGLTLAGLLVSAIITTAMLLDEQKKELEQTHIEIEQMRIELLELREQQKELNYSLIKSFSRYTSSQIIQCKQPTPFFIPVSAVAFNNYVELKAEYSTLYAMTKDGHFNNLRMYYPRDCD